MSLSIHSSEHDDRAFVEDHAVIALGFLASTLWILGYPRQAEKAGRWSVATARELGQPSALAFVLFAELVSRGLFEADLDTTGPWPTKSLRIVNNTTSSFTRVGRGSVKVSQRHGKATAGRHRDHAGGA